MTQADPSVSAPLRIVPQGDLVASTVEAERTRIMQLLEGVKGPVVLDLASVKEIDSLGITLVLGTFKTCQKAGAEFSVQGVSPDIFRVFKLFSLPKLFPITEGVQHG